MAVSEVSYNLKLDLSKVQNKSQVKKDIGEFIVDEILRYTADGKSPVKGQRFPMLDKEYADREKKGDRTPNLRLEGDLLEALTFKTTRGGVEIGVFGSEAPKADGHNNHSGESKLPLRRFIPKGDEKFRDEIMAGIETIIEENTEQTPEREVTEDILRSVIERNIIAELLDVETDES